MINQMIQFYTVENTGWSGGISWFTTGGTDTNPLRFKTETEAIEFAKRNKTHLNQDTTFWRIVRTTIIRSDNREVTTREWNMV